jgi:KipI family sensor histidine kinase inhibitor
MTDAYRIVSAGDSALILEFEDRIDPAINARAVGVADRVASVKLSGVRDVVPTFRSVAVHFDPLRTNVAELTARLENEASRPFDEVADVRPIIRVPVAYGGDLGPDLQEVADAAGITAADVVRRHAAPIYRVFMMGFLPGFAYMGTVDSTIALPRRATPRVRVPAGSVGIAGQQTGVYPSESPGGWRLIGRTAVKPYDSARPEPFLFRPGDRVKFDPMDR